MVKENITYRQDQQWRSDANCADMDTGLFFPDDYDKAGAALAACAGCAVRQACLDFALLNREKDGIWGGLTPEERTSYQRRRKRHPGSAA